MSQQPLLAVKGLSRRFGGVRAVDGVTFEVPSGGITGLIGPNGAGKTTAFDLITGHRLPDSGQIRFGDEDVTRWPADRRARAGLLRTFQITRPFPRMSVWENLLVAGSDAADETVLAAMLGRDRARERELAAHADELLEFLTLTQVADQPAAALSGGQRKLLELGRVLMRRPRLVLLDEPTAGVAPELRAQLASRLRQLHDSGLTLLIVEHDLGFLMELVDRLVVMHLGAVLIEGDPESARADERVLEAYLGGVHA
jgi:branched-chain amino acid transport system ATP-binding protein